MMRAEGLNPEITSVESGERKLAYYNEFRQMLREHPGIIKTVIELTSRAEAEYSPENFIVGGAIELHWNKETGLWEKVKVHDKIIDPPRSLDFGTRGMFFRPAEPITETTSGVEVEVVLLGESNRILETGFGDDLGKDHTDYFRVSLNNEAFFVKKSTNIITPGHSEFHNTLKANVALADLDFVRVVEAQLGYQDNNQSWYVSKWDNLESAGFKPYISVLSSGWDDYGQKIHHDPQRPNLRFGEVVEPARRKFELIYDILSKHNIHADLETNLFYNVTTGQYILLDVSSPKDIYQRMDMMKAQKKRLNDHVHNIILSLVSTAKIPL